MTSTVTVRWGIAGPGSIAAGFAGDMALLDDGAIVAVGSRSRERADDFGDRFGIPNRHGSYADLAADPEVDVVYVATPHSRHAQDTLLFLEAGKSVLCEKPFALSAAQTRRMIDLARSRRVFLMEAMWSRFLPAYRTLGELLEAGRIGEPRLVEGDFGFRANIDPTHRHFDLALGGGGLLDLGVYPVQLCSLVLGTPDHVVAAGHIGSTGVDEQVAAVLHHPGGELGVVKAAVRTSMACTARITGTGGRIDLPAMLHCPDHLLVTTDDGVERIDCHHKGNGLRFQASEVHRCLARGWTESPIMALDETLSIGTTLDAIRSAIGLVFPGEQDPSEN
jgi:predicted dehydrogenase